MQRASHSSPVLTHASGPPPDHLPTASQHLALPPRHRPQGQRVDAVEYPEVTILFSDIVGFTDIASRCTPMEICNMLDDLCAPPRLPDA